MGRLIRESGMCLGEEGDPKSEIEKLTLTYRKVIPIKVRVLDEVGAELSGITMSYRTTTPQ